MRDEALAIQERQSLSEFPQIKGIQCFCENRRAGRPGGDFFDLAAPGPDELACGVGTLLAKGIAGPILMTGLQTTLHSLDARGADLPGILAELNRIMWNIAPERTFASLFSARIVPRTRRIYYVNAGHEAALMVRFDGRIERLEPHAPVLGLSRLSEYRERTVGFHPGDTLIALTEGSGAGAERLLGSGAPDRVAMRCRDLPARIVQAAESMPGAQSSDRTVLVIHYNRAGTEDIPCVPVAPRQPLAAAA